MNPQFHVITLFPEVIETFASFGVIGQARKQDLFQIMGVNPRDFTTDLHHSVDDRPFGGGDGMCMMVEPLAKALDHVIAGAPKARRLYVSPQGRPLTNTYARELADAGDLVFLSGRYAGVDQRLLNHYQFEEISIGDYVLSGGELAVMVVIDTVARFLPGVLGHEDSANLDSFEGGLLEAPLFTRPREVYGVQVPEVLCGGNHALIRTWKLQVSRLVTMKKRPDLLNFAKLSAADQKNLRAFYDQLSGPDLKSLGLAILPEDFWATTQGRQV